MIEIGQRVAVVGRGYGTVVDIHRERERPFIVALDEVTDYAVALNLVDICTIFVTA